MFQSSDHSPFLSTSWSSIPSTTEATEAPTDPFACPAFRSSRSSSRISRRSTATDAASPPSPPALSPPSRIMDAGTGGADADDPPSGKAAAPPVEATAAICCAFRRFMAHTSFLKLCGSLRPEMRSSFCGPPLDAVSMLTVASTFLMQMHVAPAGSSMSQSVILSNGTVLLLRPASVHGNPQQVLRRSRTNRMPSLVMATCCARTFHWTFLLRKHGVSPATARTKTGG
mmetsp:Transcript_11138/g.21251  ORF Transcript_11138/g.21251 Transcript_11138/m.21251 type:complete len:228 (-) Transcript_11138:380-1063(-)